MKKITGLLSATMLIFAAGNLSAAVDESPALSGTTGYIIAPSAATQDPDTFGVGYHYITEGNYNVVNALIGISPKMELGVNSQFGNTTDIMFPLKYRFYERSIHTAIQGNFQVRENQNMGGQILVVNSWRSAAGIETSASIGYTIVDGRGSNIDFSIGFQRHIVRSLRWLRLVADFANYSYFSIEGSAKDNLGAGESIGGGLSAARGIFNLGLRAAFDQGRRWGLRMDVLGTDLLDSTRGFGIGAYGFFRI